MIALVDVDGVCADFLTAALDGVDLLPSDVKGWDFFSQLTDEESRYVRKKLASPYFWAHAIEPIESAMGFGDRLERLGYKHIIVVTSPWCKEVMGARVDWLNKHFGGQFDALCFQKRKSTIHGDLMIDDGIHNLNEWTAAHPQGKGILMSTNYNQGCDKYMRMANWSGLEDALRGDK